MDLEDYRKMMARVASLIAKTREGDEEAIQELRTICHRAAELAPPHDLARMGQLLYDIRAEAAAEHVSKG